MLYEALARGRAPATRTSSPRSVSVSRFIRASTTLLLAGVAGSCEFIPFSDPSDALESRIDRISIGQAPVLDALGDTVRLRVEVITRNGSLAGSTPVAWRSLEPGVARIDANGLITALSPGVARITASLNRSADTTQIVVRPVVTALTLLSASATLLVDDSLLLKASAVDRLGSPVAQPVLSWTTSNPDAASVSASGMVIARATGTAIVTVSSAAVTTSANLRVDPRPVAVAPPPATSFDPAKTKFGLHMDLHFDGYSWRRQRAIDIARDIGAQISRSSLLWMVIEPQRGQRDWSRSDALLAELQTAGIEPLFAVYGSPAWANGYSPTLPEVHLYVPENEAAFTTWLGLYKDFVRAAAQRYRGRVRKWEIWNEQNEYHFWKPKPDLDRYVRFYREIYAVLKEVDPANEVAMGGLAGLCCSGPQDINGRTFLEGMYTRGVFPDIVNIHPYSDHGPDVTRQWTGNFSDIQMIRDIMLRYGQGHRPIWVTEWGWQTNQVTETEQAAYVARSLSMLVDLYPYVTLATYFVDYDRAPNFFHGLVTADWRLKPSAVRFRDFMRSRPVSP